jgi:hypothetical protein
MGGHAVGIVPGQQQFLKESEVGIPLPKTVVQIDGKEELAPLGDSLECAGGFSFGGGGLACSVDFEELFHFLVAV